MYTTTRRLVVTLAVAAVAMAGALTALGTTAASAASVTTSSGQPVHVRLDQAETTAAASSLAAAEGICNSYVLPAALVSHTVADMTFPVCQVALQVCAKQADALDELAAITI